MQTSTSKKFLVGATLFATGLAVSSLAFAAEPAATAPTTQSAESVLENMLHQPPNHPTPAATSTSGGKVATNPIVTPAGEAAAPNTPDVQRMREGQFVWNRVGRLVKDEKSDSWMIAFDADGKAMQDPPMALLPSRLLMSMEQVTENGTKPVKFKISGQVTEYHGKNYLLVTFMQTVRDLNQF